MPNYYDFFIDYFCPARMRLITFVFEHIEML